MKWQVKLSQKARTDIEAALEWTLSNFGQRKHDEYIELIGLALKDIAVDPKSFRARPRPELHRDAWIIHIGSKGRKARHLFVYRVKSNGEVEVGRFLHDSMDLQRHLPEGFA